MPLQPFTPDHCGTHSGPKTTLLEEGYIFFYPEIIYYLVNPLQFHLVKCRKNHAGSDLKVCPFNASHHVPAPEEAFHMKTCSDRKVSLESPLDQDIIMAFEIPVGCCITLCYCIS